MKRREFITVLGGVAVTWPLAARAQQTPHVRRVGVLIPFPDDREPPAKDYLSAFKQRLQELGWDEARNIRFDYRFTGQVSERMRAGTEELIALAPDIIVVWANPAAAIVRKATQTIPIVFVSVSDPVGGGFVTNLGASGRKYHRLPEFRNAHRRKMAAGAQGDSAGSEPRGFRPQSGHLRPCRVHAHGGSCL